MKIAFLSNALTPHQKPFSDQMYELLRENYFFVEFCPLTRERMELGWKEQKEPYLIKYYLNEENKKKVNEIIESFDVIIYGSAPDKILVKRIKENKLTLKYAERFYRKKINWKTFFRTVIGTYLHYGRFRKNKFYILCSSAYTAIDANMFINFKNKCYKWGYFPKVEKYNIEELIKSKFSEKNNSCISILWVGRLVELKHPDISILLAEKLKNEGHNFKLSIIGTGELEENLKAMIMEKKLSDCVNMLGGVSPEEVRKYMKDADIYLFTSDRNEGWGAVLNESMNSGCAVVASHAIGSVPFLIENEKNGLIYKDGDFEDFYKKVTILVNNKEKRQKLSRNAYFTIVDVWNAENAAKRLIELVQAILKGDKNPNIFKTGVCSRAEEIRDDWFE